MITRQQVVDAVCEEYGLTVDELLTPTHMKPIVQARHVAEQVMHDAGWSWTLVADAMGIQQVDRHHAWRTPKDSPELLSVRMMLGLIPGWPAVETLPARLGVVR
jgi:hypothetical protein